MDPLSIISGVAGVAAAGVALSSALYDLVASISNAPKEMVEIAQGIHDLSTVLRELRRGMRKSRKMLSGRLFRSVSSVMDRIRDIHDKVDQLLDAEGSLARLLWAFRKSKAMKLLAIIESHKSTVQLIAVTITLAVVQREHTDNKREVTDERSVLRTQAETLVRMTEQSLQALVPRQLHRDQGTQTTNQTQPAPEGPEPSSARDSIAASLPRPTGDTVAPSISDTRLEKWDDSPEDMAAWLYRLVFQDSQVMGPSQRASIDSLIASPIPDLLVSTNRAPKAPVVDRLLLQWTDLDPVEIEETSVADWSGSDRPYVRDLERRVRLLSGGQSTPELLSPSAAAEQAGLHGNDPPTATPRRSETEQRSWEYSHLRRTAEATAEVIAEAAEAIVNRSPRDRGSSRGATPQAVAHGGPSSEGNSNSEQRQRQSSPLASARNTPYAYGAADLPYSSTAWPKIYQYKQADDVELPPSPRHGIDNDYYDKVVYTKNINDTVPLHHRRGERIGTTRRARFQPAVEDDQSDEPAHPVASNTRKARRARYDTGENAVEGEDWAKERDELLKEMRQDDPGQPYISDKLRREFLTRWNEID